MRSARVSILAGTALALVLSTAAFAAPANSDAPLIAPTRGYSTPGSMPKPSSPFASPDDGTRFRGSNYVAPQRPRRRRRSLPTAFSRSPNHWPSRPARRLRRNRRRATRSPRLNRYRSSRFLVRPRVEAPVAAPQPSPEPRKAAAPQPTATPASDAEIGAKIREMIANKSLDRMIARKQDRDAIVSLYQKSRDFRPLWIANGGLSERARDVSEYLGTVDADGLDPKDYSLPRVSGGAQSQAEAELKFTETVLTYARHAMTGRVNFTRVSPDIEYKLAFDADDVLKKVVASNDLGKTLDSFEPPHDAYKALKAKLAEFRHAPVETGPTPIESGPVLRYNRDRNGRETVMSDPRVPLLREKLNLAAEPNNNYNYALAVAVAKYQKANGLKQSGQLTADTLDALNGPKLKKLDAILATMERWRWMPRDLGKTHVVLNIPDYNLRIYNAGAKVWQTRVVVGKPDHRTPMLSETMKFITLNPTWNVPESIIYNELLPIYETSDPQIFERQGLKMERTADGKVRVFQPPGERNALGMIRFNFPNKFLVYQHDTPEKHYFAQEKRAYSHGCQRVQDPLKYAEVLLSYASPRSGYTAETIKRMLGGEEQQLDFRTQIPVHISYQTAFVDEAGKLQFREDIYGHDAKIMSILGGAERQVADQAMERPADPNFKPKPEDTQRLRSAAGTPNPFSLFEQLFR